jgi:hypothetical protein
MLFCFWIKSCFQVFTHSYLENPNAQVEPMRCPNASWEADIIVVSANALANE